MSDLSSARVIVVVFKMAGCGACAEYVPRFVKQAQMYQGCMPIFIADANDPQWEHLANRLNVQAVPATYALRRPNGMVSLIGSGSDTEITKLLDAAARWATCPVDY